MEYIFHILVMLNIYIILVTSMNLTSGMANLLTLCQAAFYGIGAYIGSFFLMQFNIPFILTVSIVVLATGLCSFVVSLASVRLKGNYFVLSTMGFQMIVYTLLYNWTSVTRGPYGISGIPGIRLFNMFEISGVYPFFIVTLSVMLIIVFVLHSISQSPYGRLLRAIRADELSVLTLGKNVSMIKSMAFFISAAFTGVAGVLYASYVSFIDPTSFTIRESVFLVCALFIGGTGNIKGPLAGACFVVLIPELFRFVGLPNAVEADLRQIIYGLALILTMLYRPNGLCGNKNHLRI